jgi:uncharacterized protein
MDLSDERVIAAGPGVVWAALFSPEVLMSCIPGCESMTGSPEAGFEATVVQKIGPVKAKFTGVVKLSDIVEGKSCTISGEGKGGPAGFAKGGAQVVLAAEGEGTRLGYTVQAHVGGKIAQLGSRLIDGFARKMADEFFSRFQAALEAPEAEVGAEAGAEAAAGAKEHKKGWFRRLIG